MKKLFLILSILFLFLLIFGVFSSKYSIKTLDYPSPDQVIQSSELGLSISLTEDSFAEPPSFIEVLIINESNQNYEFGKYYSIELKKNDEWYLVTHSDEVFWMNPSFTDLGQILKAGGKESQMLSIDFLGITLVPGEYRIVKSFSPIDGSYSEISLASTFIVD